jgi:hypothetical protein
MHVFALLFQVGHVQYGVQRRGHGRHWHVPKGRYDGLLTESEKESDRKCQETLPGTMRTSATVVPLGITACQEKLITKDK